MTGALLASEDDAPLSFIRRARELEEQHAAIDAELRRAEIDLPVSTALPDESLADAWRSACDGAKALDYEARMKVRGLVSQTFTRIAVYQRGVARRPKSNFMDLVLVGRRGQTRMLRVHRRTGEWRMAEDIGLRSDAPTL